MSGIQRAKVKITAGLLGFIIFAVIICCAIFIAHGSAHDCEGDDCPVCACIQQCLNTMHQSGDGTDAKPISQAVMPVVLTVMFAAGFYEHKTPVAVHIRINS